jgi:hypothetical protein
MSPWHSNCLASEVLELCFELELNIASFGEVAMVGFESQVEMVGAAAFHFGLETSLARGRQNPSERRALRMQQLRSH